ncbi:MAG: response regulator [Pirellulales bacterium]|nr:response regulator [Pirellulales bacterium]
MSKRLLVTDDAPIIREIIKDAAQSAGWEIAGEAGNGQMAVEMYQTLRPDVCTLDLVMPEYDGMHGLRGIKALNPDAKVVIVSALDQKNVLKETFRLGVSDFIVKPFDKTSLIDTLEQLVADAG